jgi:hypothetical protein
VGVSRRSHAFFLVTPQPAGLQRTAPETKLRLHEVSRSRITSQ